MLGPRAANRIGGDVVAESLHALGAEVVFGLPGVHALPIWEGVRRTPLRLVGFRQELNAAFAADGYARAERRPAPLVVSTGPGALMTLAPLMESFMAFVPVVVVSSQIDAAAIAAGRGHLHESPDQAASFAPLVKWTGRPGSVAEIPDVLAEAWRRAATPPQGPTYVEVPFDVLQVPAAEAPGALDGTPEAAPLPSVADLDAAAAILAAAERPAIVAGGGAVRSGAQAELLALAERLGAAVATTYAGKGVFPERHPLALGSGWDDASHTALLVESDAVLVVGSWLGYELTDSFRLRLPGTIVQIDAAPERIGLNHPAVGLTGDARAVLGSLLERIPPSPARDGATSVAAARRRVDAALAEQPRALELGLVETIDAALPAGAVASWDCTILAYTGAWYARVSDPRRFLYPTGSSTLGYAFPAALGAACGATKALAVVGDGGFQYAIAELATARQHQLDVAVLLIDDGGYGILRSYQAGAGFPHEGVTSSTPTSSRSAVPTACPRGSRRPTAWAPTSRGPWRSPAQPWSCSARR